MINVVNPKNKLRNKGININGRVNIVLGKLFPYLQKYIPRYRSNKLLQILDKFSTTYHSIYENLNYDCANNGELFLLNKLNTNFI